MLCESQALWIRQVERTIKSRFTSTWQNCDKKEIIFDIVQILHFIHGISKAVEISLMKHFYIYHVFVHSLSIWWYLKWYQTMKAAYRYKILKKAIKSFTNEDCVHLNLLFKRYIIFLTFLYLWNLSHFQHRDIYF